MAIKIPFLADVRSFLFGTRDLEESLDDVIDSLDDVTRAGAKVDDQVGADFDSVAKDADAAADKIDKSFREAFRSVEAQGRTSSRKVRTEVDEIGHKGSATLHEFGQEARQNVAESVSSFTGSASSAVDAIQSTFGGLVSALGPAGLIGAAAAAAGIGLARGLFEKSRQQAQEVAEAVAEITGQLIELGTTSLGGKEINDRLKELASTAENGKNALGEIADTAKAAGIGFRDYARGLAGDNTAIRASYAEVLRRVGELDEAQRKLMHTRNASQAEVDALIASQLDERAALESARKALLEQDSTLDEAAATTRLYADATRDAATVTDTAASSGVAYVGVTRDQADVAAAAAEAIRRKNDAMAVEVSQNMAVEQATLAYQSALDDATKALKENGETHDANTAKGRGNRTALLNLARTILDLAAAREADTGKARDYNRVIAAHREEFRKAAAAAGYTKDQVDKLAHAYGLVPKVVKTKVTDDGTAAATQQKIDNIHSSGVPVPVNPDLTGFDSSVKQYLNGKAYYVTVRARPGKNVAT